jgi:hypothetical protein
LKIDIADEESPSDSDVDFEPPSPMPESRRGKTRTEPTEAVSPTATMRQESGRDGTVWVEKSDEFMWHADVVARQSNVLLLMRTEK